MSSSSSPTDRPPVDPAPFSTANNDPDIYYGLLSEQPAWEEPNGATGIGAFARQWGDRDDHGLFMLARAIFAESDDRCDVGYWGPGGWYEGASSTDHPVARMDTIRWVDIVVPILPHGYILWLRLDTPEREQEALDVTPIGARTLPELFRLLLEYAWAAENGSDVPQAATALAVRDELRRYGLGEHEPWLLGKVPHQKLHKYLEGNKRAKRRSKVPPMPERFDEWLNWIVVSSDRAFGGLRTSDGAHHVADG